MTETIELYPRDQTDFSHHGHVLDDVSNDVVSWQLNAKFTLTFDYPMMSKYAADLVADNIVRVPVPGGATAFRIKTVVKSMGLLSITAYQVFWDLNDNFLADTNVVEKDGQAALDQIMAGANYDAGFKAMSSIGNTASARLVRMSIVNALIGTDDNSFLNRWGGEFDWQDFSFSVNPRIGKDRGVRFEYAHNLLGYTATKDSTSIITRLLPEGYNGLLLPELYVDSPLIGSYRKPKVGTITYSDIKAIDKTQTTGDQDGAVPVKDAYKLLRDAAAKEFSDNHIDQADWTYKLNVVLLENTEEYKSLGVVSQVLPGDTVHVKHTQDDIDVEARLTAYTWQPTAKQYLTQTYDSTSRPDVAYSSLSSQVSALANQVQLIDKVTIAKAANGLNSITWSDQSPIDLGLDGKEGDVAYQTTASGTHMWIYHDGAWHDEASDATGTQIQKEVDTKLGEMTATMAQANADLATAKKNVAALDGKLAANEKTQADLTKQLADNTATQAQLTQTLADNTKLITTNKSDVDAALATVDSTLKQATADTAAAVKQAEDAVTAANAAVNASGLATDAANAANDAATAAKALATQVSGDVADAQAQATTAAEDAAKALAAANSASTTAKTASQTVDNLNGTIKTLATAESVNAVKGDVSKATSDITILGGKVAEMYTKSEVTGLLAPYATQSWSQNLVTKTAGEWSAKLTSVEGKIDTMTVSSRNLIRNSSIFSNIAPWSVPYGDATLQAAKHQFWKNGSENLLELMAGPGVTSGHASSNRFDLEPNSTYTFQLKAFHDLGVKSVTIYLLSRSYSDQTAGVDYNTKTGIHQIVADTTFSTAGYVEKSWQVKTGAADQNGYIRIDTNTVADGGKHTLYMTQIALKKESVLSDYTPASEDATTYTDQKASELTVTIDSYKQQLAAVKTTADTATTNLQTVQSTANSTSSLLATVQNNVKSLRRAGANLVYNSNAELGLDGWTANHPNHFALSTHGYWYNGTKKFFYIAPNGPGTNDETYITSNKIPVKPNTTYHLHFFWIAPVDVSGIDVYYLNSESGVLTKAWKPAPSDHGNYDKDFNVGDNTNIQIRIDINGSTDGNAKTWLGIAEICLSEGAGVVPWSASASDSATVVAFNSVKSTVDGTVQSIGSINGQITTINANINGIQSTVKDKASQSQVTQLSTQWTSAISGLSNPNLIVNSKCPTGNNDLLGWLDVSGLSNGAQHNAQYNAGGQTLFKILNDGATRKSASTNRFKVQRNATYTFTLSAISSPDMSGMNVFLLKRSGTNDADYATNGVQQLISGAHPSSTKLEEYKITFDVGEFDEAYIRIDNTGSTDGSSAVLYFAEPKVELGTMATPDVQSGTDSQITQLQDDISLRVNVDGKIASQLNLSADGGGTVLIEGKSVHITGATSIDKAVIHSANISELDATKITTGILSADRLATTKLNASNITTGTLDAGVIGVKNLSANSITSGSIGAGLLATTKLSATNIVSGTLDAGKLIVKNIDAGSIASGYIAAERLATTKLSATNIISGELDAGVVKVKNLSASTLTGGTINGNTVNVVGLNASSITTGTITGAKLAINLNTGQVVFQSGRIHDTANHIDINIDPDGIKSYVSVANTDNRVLIKDGQIQFIQPTLFDIQKTPYLSISNSGVGQNWAGATIVGRDSVMVANSANVGDILSYGLGVNGFSGLVSGKNSNGNWDPTVVGGAERGVVIVGGSVTTAMVGASPFIRVGSDVTGMKTGNRIYVDAEYFHVPTSYNHTGSGSANLIVKSDGAIVRTSSATKYKSNIDRFTSTDMAEKLLTLPAAHWYNKGDLERYAQDPQHTEPPLRDYGMIAEDLAAAGLEDLVVRGTDGELEDIRYDRMAVALLPLLAQMKQEITQLKGEK